MIKPGSTRKLKMPNKDKKNIDHHNNNKLMWTVCVYFCLCTSTALNQKHISVGRYVTIQRNVAAVREIKNLTGSVPQVTPSPCLFVLICGCLICQLPSHGTYPSLCDASTASSKAVSSVFFYLV